MGRRLSWLIFLPAAILGWFAPAVSAEPQPGLTAVGYTITDIPPEKSDAVYQQCGEDIVPFINVTFDYEQNLFGDCGWDMFMVHYTGYLTIPEHETLELMVASDDGGTVKIGTEEFGSWNTQGCAWTMYTGEGIQQGLYQLDAWFFEAGGATCFMLAWNIDGTGWTIVPPEAFTVDYTPVTTTTTTTSTTTTVEETTTTTTTTTSTTTTTTTTSTTTTQAPAPPPPPPPPAPTTTEPSTTVPETTTTTVPETTTTTTVQPTTSIPQTTLPPTTAQTTTSVPAPTTLPPQSTTIPSTTTVAQEQVTVNATPNQIIQAVADIPPGQAAEVFAEINVGELTEEQQQALVAAVQEAPQEVREAFEEEIDIFKEGLDDYVPVGSNVPVGTRRALVAIGAAMTAAGAATRMRR